MAHSLPARLANSVITPWTDNVYLALKVITGLPILTALPAPRELSAFFLAPLLPRIVFFATQGSTTRAPVLLLV